jgi:hypothetical protein
MSYVLFVALDGEPASFGINTDTSTIFTALSVNFALVPALSLPFFLPRPSISFFFLFPGYELSLRLVSVIHGLLSKSQFFGLELLHSFLNLFGQIHFDLGIQFPEYKPSSKNIRFPSD